MEAKHSTSDLQAFHESKESLAQAAFLVHPWISAELALFTDIRPERGSGTTASRTRLGALSVLLEEARAGRNKIQCN